MIRIETMGACLLGTRAFTLVLASHTCGTCFFPSQPSPKLLPPTFNKDLIENPVLAKFSQCA